MLSALTFQVLKMERKQMANRWKQPDYMPTPQEIAQKCEEIQRHWSERERRRRMRFVVSDSKVGTINKLDPVEIEPHERAPQHPDVLTTGCTRNTRVSLSLLGV